MHDAEDPEKVRDQAARIVSSGEQLLGLINNVLDMSKIETGSVETSVRKFRLSDVVHTVENADPPGNGE